MIRCFQLRRLRFKSNIHSLQLLFQTTNNNNIQCPCQCHHRHFRLATSNISTSTHDTATNSLKAGNNHFSSSTINNEVSKNNYVREQVYRLLTEISSNSHTYYHNDEKRQSWMLNRIHSVMFQFVKAITLPSFDDKNMNTINVLKLDTTNTKSTHLNNNHFHQHEQCKWDQLSNGALLERIIHLTRTSLSIPPTPLMYKYTIEACCIVPLSYKHNKSSINTMGDDIRLAESIFQQLLDHLSTLTLSQYHDPTGRDLQIQQPQSTTSIQSFSELCDLVNTCFHLVICASIRYDKILSNTTTTSTTNSYSTNSRVNNEKLLQRFLSILSIHDLQFLQQYLFPNESYSLSTTINNNINFDETTAQNDCNPLGQTHILLNTNGLNAILHIMISNGDIRSINNAENFVRHILNSTATTNSNSLNTSNHPSEIKPNTVTLNIILNAYAHLGDITKVESTFQWFESLYKQKKIQFPPDVTTFNILLNAYVKASASDDAGKLQDVNQKHLVHKVVSLLKSMEQSHHNTDTSASSSQTFSHFNTQTQNYQIVPDIITYTTIINTLAKHKMAKEAHQLLQNLIHFAMNTHDHPTQTTNTDNYSHKRENHFFPDNVLFTSVINAWAESKQHDDIAIRKSKEIISLMLKYESEYPNAFPNTITFNTYLKALSNHLHNDNLSGTKQRNRNGDCNEIVSEALTTLQIMEDRYAKLGHEFHNLKPNVNTYNTIFSIMKKAKEFKLANQLFEQITTETADPNLIDIITINTFFSCLAYERNVGVEKCLEIFKFIKKETSHSRYYNIPPSIIPNTRTYNAVLNVISKAITVENSTGLILEMETILDEMENLNAKQSKQDESRETTNTIVIDPNIIPDTHTFSISINAISRSSLPDKAQRAISIFRRMEASYQRGNHKAIPNTITLNLILSSCARATMDSNYPQVRSIAENLFQEMKEKKYPKCDTSPTTYQYMIDIYSKYYDYATHTSRNINNNHNPNTNKEKIMTIENLFLDCIKEKKVNKNVLNSLRTAIPKHVYARLTLGI